jgi:hypothetical protein
MRPASLGTYGVATVVCILALVSCADQPGQSRPGARESASPARSTETATPWMASAGQSPSATTPAGFLGLVRGQVVRPPGSDPRSGNAAGGSVPVNGDPIHAYDQHRRVVATAVSASGGFFEFVLRPGVYRIAEDICGASQQVEVRSRARTSLILTIPDGC